MTSIHLHCTYFAVLFAFFLKPTGEVCAQRIGSWDASVPASAEGNTLSLAWAGGLNSVQYNSIDLNNDGQKDLLLFDRSSNTLHPFLRQNNQWIYAQEYAALFPANLQSWVLLADYDNDGDPDLFTASGGRGISAYRNDRAGNGLLTWTLVAETIRTTAFVSGATVTLQVNSSDYPAITDIDQDGDLDVINYSVVGSGELILHENQSIEQYGHADSLIYQTTDLQWGDVEECDCGLFAFGDQTCDDLNGGSRKLNQEKLQHVGGKTLLVLDADGDGDLDVLTGDEGCFGIAFLENEPVNGQVFFQRVATDYPTNTLPATSLFFPGAYLADGDGDNVPDLMLSPNASTNTEDAIDFERSSWWYRNEGTAQNPQWSWSTSGFLQEDMIDVGENAAPALADYDADGDLDLFIGNRGVQRADGYYTGLYLYENMGTSQNPSFQFVTNNHLDLSEWELQELKPYFTDIDQDGLVDLLISGREAVSRETRLYALLNQADGLEAPYQFLTGQRQALELAFRSEDNLAFYDVDQDQQMDVLVGKQSGNLIYYRNQSESFPPQWVQEDDAFAGFDRNARGLFLTPAVIDADGTAEIISTDISGSLLVRPIDSDGTESSVDTILVQNELLNDAVPVQLGQQNWLTLGALNGSNRVSVVIGSQRGGVSLLHLNVGSGENPGEQVALLIYPNPATEGTTTLEASGLMRSVQVINTAGQLVQDYVLSEPLSEVNLESATLPTGLYIIRAFFAQGGVVSTKLLVHN
jgi:hypothetical protein